MIQSGHVTYLGHLSFPPSIISMHINCTFYQSPVVTSGGEDSVYKEFMKLLKCYFVLVELAAEMILYFSWSIHGDWGRI